MTEYERFNIVYDTGYEIGRKEREAEILKILDVWYTIDDGHAGINEIKRQIKEKQNE